MNTLSLRRLTAAALVVAPALFLLDNLLHPEEFARGNEAEQLAAIADAYTRWQAAHAIGFVSILGFAVAAAGLAALLGKLAPRPAVGGGALAIAGLLGLAGVLAIDGFAWGILGEISARPEADARTVELALEDVQGSEWSLVFYLMPLAFIAGLLVLCAGAVRHRLVPTWAGLLLGLGVMMVGTEPVIVSNAYYVAGAAVLLAGGVAVALSIAREPAS